MPPKLVATAPVPIELIICPVPSPAAAPRRSVLGAGPRRGRPPPGQFVLPRGEEVADAPPAIADPAAVQELAVVQCDVAHHRADLQMAPGLFDPPPGDKIRRLVLPGVEEGGAARA